MSRQKYTRCVILCCTCKVWKRAHPCAFCANTVVKKARWVETSLHIDRYQLPWSAFWLMWHQPPRQRQPGLQSSSRRSQLSILQMSLQSLLCITPQMHTMIWLLFTVSCFKPLLPQPLLWLKSRKVRHAPFTCLTLVILLVQSRYCVGHSILHCKIHSILVHIGLLCLHCWQHRLQVLLPQSQSCCTRGAK